MATWNTILTELRREIEEPTASVWSDAQLLAWLNEGIKDFARKTRTLNDEQYATTVIDQKSYALPTNTLEVTGVRFKDDLLYWRDYAEIVTLTATGTPTDYAIAASGIYLYPTPNVAATLTILRYYEPAALTATGDSLPYSSLHDRALKDFVKARAHEQIRDFEAANYYDALYQREVDETDFERVRDYAQNVSLATAEVW